MSLFSGFLKTENFLEALTEDERTLIDQMAQRHLKEKSIAIFAPKESADKLFILLSGRVKVSTFSNDGKEAIKSVIGEGEIFGEEGLFQDGNRQDLALPMDDEVEFYEITIQVVHFLMKKLPNLGFQILSHISRRIQKTERRIQSLAFNNSRDRIIEFLKETAHKQGRQTGHGVFLRSSLTQKDIAHLTTTSRQTVSSVLNELKDRGFIHYDRESMIIRDFTQLGFLEYWD